MAEQLSNECGSLGIAQRRKGDGLSTGQPSQRPLVLRPVGDHHQRRRLRDHLKEIDQHRLTDLINPVDILDHEDHRGIPSQRGGID